MSLCFHWLKEKDYFTIPQTFASFKYDMVYVGNKRRLVITTLTDRCYLPPNLALHFKCGGNPQGPAGTGKTKPVKDLANTFAKFCIMFNCTEGPDFKSMGNIVRGLAHTGGCLAWMSSTMLRLKCFLSLPKVFFVFSMPFQPSLSRFAWSSVHVQLTQWMKLFSISWVRFGPVWFVGGTLDDEGRREADSWIREIESP